MALKTQTNSTTRRALSWTRLLEGRSWTQTLVILGLFIGLTVACVSSAYHEPALTAKSVDLQSTSSSSATQTASVVKVGEQTKWVSLGTYRVTAYCQCEVCCGNYSLNRPLDPITGLPMVIGASQEVLTAGRSVAVHPSQLTRGLPMGASLNERGECAECAE